ncbi:MAG: FAD-binding protein [Acidimicrobiales bacterium]
MTQEPSAEPGARPPGGAVRPLRIAALVKQVPVAEELVLGPDGRLERDGMDLEMNAYCRRAVSKGVELAGATGGTCTVLTLGPPSADDVLREAVAWGADRGVHVCDPAFAGSDTLATARALAAALRRCGPFDLVLVGRNTIDGDTGQVGPELAELSGLAFAAGVRRLERSGEQLALHLEHDDGSEDVVVGLPVLLSVAERLCEPCKVPPEGRRAVPADRIERLSAADLGTGPWGLEGSPTRVGAVRTFRHTRDRRRLEGPLEDQVAEALALLAGRGALGPVDRRPSAEDGVVPDVNRVPRDRPSTVAGAVVVVTEEGRPVVTAELLAAAGTLGAATGRAVVVFSTPGDGTPGDGSPGDGGTAGGWAPVDRAVVVRGAEAPEDVAGALVSWARRERPWAVLAPSTDFGREVAGRAAAALGAGLVGDGVGLSLHGGELVAAKPAFSGALVADITWTSPVRMVTVRPGVLPLPAGARPAGEHAPAGDRVPAGEGAWPGAPLETEELTVAPRRRVARRGAARDDDLEVLARSEAVIGVGTGVEPDEYPRLSPLAALLGAELAATRKVTDKGWAPRSRQVGITGRSIAPRLYVAVGLSGKFNHMVGVRAAGTILAINADPAAPVFEHADVGIVADWHDALPLLEAALRRRAAGDGTAGPAAIGRASQPTGGR